MTEPPDVARLLTAVEVAELLGLPETWMRDRPRAGDVPALRFGKYVRYDRATFSPGPLRSRRAGGEHGKGPLSRPLPEDQDSCSGENSSSSGLREIAPSGSTG